MTLLPLGAARANVMPLCSAGPLPLTGKGSLPGSKSEGETRQVFNQFVGETMFGLALKAMRKSQQKPAYFYGGQAEEVFRQQLDQVLAKQLGANYGEKLSGSMFELSQLSRY